MGMASVITAISAGKQRYKNRFGTEIALLRTSESGMARMAVCWDAMATVPR